MYDVWSWVRGAIAGNCARGKSSSDCHCVVLIMRRSIYRKRWNDVFKSYILVFDTRDIIRVVRSHISPLKLVLKLELINWGM